MRVENRINVIVVESLGHGFDERIVHKWEVGEATTGQLPYLHIALALLCLYLSSSPSPEISHPSELTQ